MNALDYQALAPHLTLTGALLLVMLAISFRRSHRTAAWLTVLSLIAVLLVLPLGLGAGARQVTPLLMLDGYAAFLNGLFVLMALVTALLSQHYLRGRSGDQEEFYLLLLLATLGALTLSSAQHFATLLLGLEIISISLYTLVAYPEEGHPPLEAALKYLVLSGVGSTTMLFGMALIYHATGTMQFAEIAAAVPSGGRAEVWMVAGQVMLVAGIAFKLSLMPFHMWTPDVYQGAPAPVAGFLATVSKAAVFAVLLRFAVQTDLLDSRAVFGVLAVMAVLSMVVGNLLALLQESFKRLLAYSSIAHMGYLMIGLLVLGALGKPTLAVETGLVFLAGYMATTIAAFSVITALSGADEVEDRDGIAAYAGLFWRHPLLAAALTTALLSLAGIPLTAGFIAKFYLFVAGIEGTLWGLVWAMILGSAISIYYYLRIVFAMTLREAPEGPSAAVLSAVTTALLGLAILLVGIYPAPLVDLAGQIAEALAGTSPAPDPGLPFARE